MLPTSSRVRYLPVKKKKPFVRTIQLLQINLNLNESHRSLRSQGQTPLGASSQAGQHFVVSQQRSVEVPLWGQLYQHMSSLWVS